MSGRIFLNYRRNDDPGTTGRVFDQLEASFSKESLFMDVEGHIRPGDDFVSVLDDYVSRCDVLLAVVGPRWLDLIAANNNRQDDFVFIEIKAALDHGKRVIPVLIGDSRMPPREALPDDLQSFTRRQAVIIRHEHFRADCDRLVKELERALSEADRDRNIEIEAENRIKLQKRPKSERSTQASIEPDLRHSDGQLTIKQQVPEQLLAHLFADGPKRILSLDGGAVKSVIQIAYLERIEAILRAKHSNADLILSDYFDFVGGASTGALLATAITLGYKAQQIKELLFDFLPKMFRQPLLSVPAISPRFDTGQLAKQLLEEFGDRPLGSGDIKTGLAILTKRLDTNSLWVLTNNPRGRFWENSTQVADQAVDTAGAVIGSKHLKLRDLLRASTSAPYYFAPKKMQIGGNEKGLFADGGISAHNNPSLKMLMLATAQEDGFNWKHGADKIFLVSIGAGSTIPKTPLMLPGFLGSLTLPLAIRSLRSVVSDAEINNLETIEWLSNPRLRWTSERRRWPTEERAVSTDGGLGIDLLSFQRFDVVLDSGWLSTELGIEMKKKEVEKLDDMMNPAIARDLYQIAVQAAEKQVVPIDFPETFDLRT